MKRSFFASLLALMLACNSDSSTQATSENLQEQYALIVHIAKSNDTTIIDADYIQYLTGDSAIEAAKKEQGRHFSNTGRHHSHRCCQRLFYYK